MKTIRSRDAMSCLLGLVTISLGLNSFGSSPEDTNYDVLYCRNGADLLREYPDLGAATNASAEFVGSYAVVESRMKRGLSFSFAEHSPAGSENEEVRNQRVLSVLDQALERIRKFDPPRADRYGAWAKEFFGLANIASISSVQLLAPEGPGGCGGRKMIFQREPKFKEDYRYYVSKQLWKLMDVNHQAAAILHAFVARELSDMKRADSMGARYFTANVLSPKFLNLTLKQYMQLLRYSELFGGLEKRVWADGDLYHAELALPGKPYTEIELSISDKGNVLAAYPVKDKPFKFGDQIFVHAAGHRFLYTKSGAVRICPAGGMSRSVAVNVNGRTFQVPAFRSYTSATRAFDIENDCSGNEGGIWVFPSGRILGLSLSSDAEFQTAYGMITFRHEVFFDENGGAASGYMVWPGGKLKVSSGRILTFRKGTHLVQLSPEGLVVDRYEGKEVVWAQN